MSVNEKMTAIADAIRAKTGGTTSLTLDQMVTAIAGISGGGDSDAGSSRVYIGEITGSGESLDVVHNLGTTDILLAVCWDESDTWANAKYLVMSMYLKTDYADMSDIVVVYDGMGTSVKFSGKSSTPVDENTFRFMYSGVSTELFGASAGNYTVVIVAAE